MPNGNDDPSKKEVAVPATPPAGPEQCRYEPTPAWWRLIELIGIAAVVVYSFITWRMWRDSHNNFVVDERAWVGVSVPTVFPLNGTSIPAAAQLVNSGKTPARGVEGDIVATVISKGDQPTVGDFSIGHPHNRLYVGAIFPGAPIPMTIAVVHYGPQAAETIVPDETLRQDIANGNRSIIFYGRITYYDVFGVQHWTQFCTGSGAAMQDSLKQCIGYNDVDSNKK
jgi:hypothetical protein